LLLQLIYSQALEIKDMHLMQCFSNVVPWNLSIPRVAPRGSAETVRNFWEQFF